MQAMFLTTLLLSLGDPTTAESAFEKHVRPVLVEQCQSCHGPKKQMAGLRLDSREALLKGGDTGPAIKPGDPEKSLLIQAIRHTGDLKMPKKKLPTASIDALTVWVKAGAPWPASRVPATKPTDGQNHWAFQPVRRVDVPTVRANDWAANPIDRFILAKLEAKHLTPSPRVDRRTLARRVYFDLVGVPPTPEEMSAFVADARPGAYERLVDRLLASPRYGERWARHWLDVARFADTKGYVFFEDANYPWAWTYRDYVIEAFNHDLPYDRFLLEQIAADQLDLKDDRRPLRAMGFLRIGGKFMNNPHDIIDDRIDVVTRGLLGLTVGCARCHDHKFDPIPTADYYSLYGVFASTTEPTVSPEYDPPANTPTYVSFQKELAKREKSLTDYLESKREKLRTSARTRLAEYLLAVHARRGQPRADDFMLLADPNDINPAMTNRWQAYLERKVRSRDPVWVAWEAFAALPAKDFAALARQITPRIASGKFEDNPIHPLVAAAFKDSPPVTIKHVAERYSRLLNDIDKHRQQAGRLDTSQKSLIEVFHGPDAPPDITPGLFSELELLPDRAAQGELRKFRTAVEQWRATGPGAPPRANVLVDAKKLYDPVVFRRGNPANPGERVPRQFLGTLSGPNRKPFAHGSGRLELAQAIIDPKNPLTARVIVNRLWMHHFGRGLVDTPGDFGLRSNPPTHPELLDWLANELIESGWSLKHLHRLIVTSATYQQASVDRPDARANDPDNLMLWKMNRRPMDLEGLRDTLLVVGDQLDGHIGGASVKGEMSPGIRRRTLYSFVDRLHVQGLFRAFDFPSPDASSPKRDSTMVPQQVLFLMNSPFTLHAAKSLSNRTNSIRDVEDRLCRMYQVAFQRNPSDEERTIARAFLDTAGPQGWEKFAQALLMSNEFVFVD